MLRFSNTVSLIQLTKLSLPNLVNNAHQAAAFLFMEGPLFARSDILVFSCGTAVRTH
jgi:hypothetical protein